MKSALTIIISIAIVGTSYAQSGWEWFSRNKVPLYNPGAVSFTDFRIINGKPADGFLADYYLTKNGEQVDGEVQYNYPYIMERMLVFRQSGNVKFISPRDVKGYFVDGVYRESVTFNASLIKGAESEHTYFMIPKVQGTLNLFYYTNQEIDWPNILQPKDDQIFTAGNYFHAFNTFHAQPESEIHRGPSSDIIKKGDEPGFSAERFILGFPNKMSALVAECDLVAQKVKTKQTGYKSTNLEKIIKEYNACLETK